MNEQLKRRLLGATLLASLLVIFVPMFFDEKPRTRESLPDEVPPVSQNIEEKGIDLPRSPADVVLPEPSRPKVKQERTYRVVPLDDENSSRQAKKTGVKNTQSGAANSQAKTGDSQNVNEDNSGTGEEGEEFPPATESSDSLSATRVPSGTRNNKSGEQGVEMRSLPDSPEVVSNEKDHVEALPATNGQVSSSHKAQMLTTDSKDKRIVAEPQAGKKKLKDKSGSVIPNSPEKQKNQKSAKSVQSVKAPKIEGAAAKTNTVGSWTVQAGSFSSEANAKALAEKLRKQKLPASVRVLRRDTGNVYRVVVDKESDHSKAQELQRKVESVGGVKAILLPQH